SVQVGPRRVRLGVFPMGVDVPAFDTLARSSQVVAAAEAIRSSAGGRRIVLGIDRLDYTKGIPRRLLAIERLLTREPALRDAIRYVQIAVPSRGMVDSYQSFKRQVEETVGRINGTCGTLQSTPIHYMYGSVSQQQLVALYRAADVMLVTPLRDGMNLVAKEFLASRVDGDGVLVLSEFAGATSELGDAVVVNPYDVDAMAGAIQRALALDETERRVRMRRLRESVASHDVHQWAAQFLAALHADNAPIAPPVLLQHPGDLVDELSAATRLIVLLDYDGTLVPLAPLPHLAVPDGGLLDDLRALAEAAGVEVHLVSGRPRESLSAWFGGLPLSLWAEHGFWHRGAGDDGWAAATPVPTDWMNKVAPILEQFTATTPGSLVETKSVSLAWHYRLADPEFGARQAHELRMLLGDTLSNQPLEVLEGHTVIEVRYRGMTKAAVAHHLAPLAKGTAILAIGDDRTDEDLFGALPSDAMTVCVGHRSSRARFRLPDYQQVRRLLRALVDVRRGRQSPALPTGR
ncbi:MAG: trehalose-phosphatase, partial [Vicinamibacterales bacterium]